MGKWLYGITAVLLGVSLACSSPEVASNDAFSSTPPGVDATVAYLASDLLEGRGVGTDGIDRAAEFIAARFGTLGLLPPPGMPDYFQSFDMTTAMGVGPGTALGSAGRSFALGVDFTAASFSAEDAFDEPVVFAGYGITNPQRGYDDYTGIDAKGKVVVAMRFEPHDDQGKSRFTNSAAWSDDATLIRKTRNAVAHGAAALVLVNPPIHHGAEDLLMPFARQFAGEHVSIPVIQVKRQVVDELLERASRPRLDELQRDIDSTTAPRAVALDGVTLAGSVEIERVVKPVRNVIAYLPGRGPLADEVIVVGAHYDHLGRGRAIPARAGGGSAGEIYNGADDNASGAAAMLALAERVKRTGPHARSMLFVAFTAEESGLIGSAHFVEHPPVPMDKVVAMLNFDMVGRVRNDILYIGGSGTAAEFEDILRRADEASPLQIKTMGKSGFGPSDHMSFALKRVPVLFFFSGLHSDYHRPTDDADKINTTGIERVVDLAAMVIASLLDAPRPQYVNVGDPHSGAAPSAMGPGGGVMLGVVPDYATDETTTGVRITGTVPNSPAAAAGLRSGDVITRFGDQKIETLYDLSDALRSAKTGQTVTLLVTRDGKPLELKAMLAERQPSGHGRSAGG
ncbi:MAG: M20/M25/M40 family metallo-hydrolase [Tepidisphaeraceae bacterium]